MNMEECSLLSSTFLVPCHAGRTWFINSFKKKKKNCVHFVLSFFHVICTVSYYVNHLFLETAGVQRPGHWRKKVEFFCLNGHLVSTSAEKQTVIWGFLKVSWQFQPWGDTSLITSSMAVGREGISLLLHTHIHTCPAFPGVSQTWVDLCKASLCFAGSHPPVSGNHLSMTSCAAMIRWINNRPWLCRQSQT